MTLNKIKYLIYGVYLTLIYASKLKKVHTFEEKKIIRLSYAKLFFSKLNIRITIENKDNIPLAGQYLIFSNHRSILDPLALDIVFQKSTIFGLWIAKKELYDSWLFGKAAEHGGCIRLDRDKKNTKIFFSDISKGLDGGASICIFPEGTRNKGDKALLPFKKGLGIIALKNNLPLLPIYIKSHASNVLEEALRDNANEKEIVIVIGETVPANDRNDLEITYKKMFDLL